MLVRVVDEDTKKLTPVGPWSEFHGDKTADINELDGLTPIVDHNSVTFCYHYREKQLTTNGNGYQVPEVFKKQVATASEHFKDMDFQMITFNVQEEETFGPLMKDLGFELMGNSLGRSNTPITLYIKTKRE